MRLSYNAPIVLTFAIVSAGVLVVDLIAGGGIAVALAVPPDFAAGRVIDYVRLVTHPFAHADWTHLVANFSLILLIGPILEEKYGGMPLVVMMVATALVTGLLNVLFLPTGLMGASGVVFMMIILSSFANFRKGEIPLTFVLVVLIYLAREIVNAFTNDTISQFAHLVGGACGSLFGFVFTRSARPPTVEYVEAGDDSVDDLPPGSEEASPRHEGAE